MSPSVSGKTFAVTGGASGLGEATVRMLVAAGANVAVLDRDAEKGEQVGLECGDKAKFFALDVSSEDSCKAAVAATVEAFGALHGVVNCAGVAAATLTFSKRGVHPSDIFNTVQQINVAGTFNMCKYGAEAMSKNEPDESGLRGVLINVSSLAGLEGQKGQVAYAASKAAVNGMTLPLARDLAPFGIRAMAIAPGIMETPMMAAASENVRLGLVSGVVAPKRFGLPSEFAHLVLSIAENSYLNGEVIRFDGALRMGYASKL